VKERPERQSYTFFRNSAKLPKCAFMRFCSAVSTRRSDTVLLVSSDFTLPSTGCGWYASWLPVAQLTGTAEKSYMSITGLCMTHAHHAACGSVSLSGNVPSRFPERLFSLHTMWLSVASIDSGSGTSTACRWGLKCYPESVVLCTSSCLLYPDHVGK
jgi:hypothetical protein